jgi:hypothetical protein
VVTRRAVTVAGVGIIVAYALLAAWSGRLSPLARRPLLDGTTALPYRWVSPPPELASTNQQPESADAFLKLTSKGVKGQVVVTPDQQAIVVIADGVIAAHGKDDEVEVKVVPVDPQPLASAGGQLAFFGNAYRITATYQPSNTTVHGLASGKQLDVALTYPATATLQSASHELLFSPDASPGGDGWTPLKTNDTPSVSQAEALTPDLGDVVVAGVPSSPVVTVTPGTVGGGSNTLRLALIVGAVCALLIGIGLVLRARGQK